MKEIAKTIPRKTAQNKENGSNTLLSEVQEKQKKEEVAGAMLPPQNAEMPAQETGEEKTLLSETNPDTDSAEKSEDLTADEEKRQTEPKREETAAKEQTVVGEKKTEPERACALSERERRRMNCIKLELEIAKDEEELARLEKILLDTKKDLQEVERLMASLRNKPE
ncbi:MAG: uncharacterized protein A8A55_1466 [Amphiamblys sp. WSBS2006]|nr:MAG: uncharacterized protein A8A55_1466 [Amphiamblys sp. WSBS2006]